MKRTLARTAGTTAFTAAVVATLAASNAAAAPPPTEPSAQPAASQPTSSKSSPNQSSPNQSAQPATTELQAVQRDLGLTADQAKQRLQQESVANRADSTLRGALGGTYGGAHYDSRQGHLVVGVTSPNAFDSVRASGADPVLVHFSSQQLDGAADALRQAPAPPQVTGWYVDPAANAVVVTAKRGSSNQAQDFVRTSGVAPGAARVVESDEAPRTYADVIGGNGYTINNAASCTIGFAVQDGFLSAGHCAKQGDRTAGPEGTVTASKFPGNDYSAVRTAPAETPQPLVNNYQGGTVGVAGSTEAAVGTAVCRSGATSGWHCGTLQAKNQSVRYPEGDVTGLDRTDVCAEPGDSGGSFLAGDQAQGITSGGSGDCVHGGTTYFEPINPVLEATGTQLLTK